MSRLVVLVALISVGLAAAVLADVPKCAAGLNVGTVCHIKASNVKPTQFAYGRVASACKAQYIESMSSSKLEKYLSKYVCSCWRQLGAQFDFGKLGNL